MKKTMWYIDLDGVLADWKQGYNNLENVPSLNTFNNLSKKDKDALKHKFYSYDFFYGLDPIDKGLKMIESLMETNNVCICSAVGSINSNEITKAKQDWIKKYIGDIEAIFVDKVENKHKYRLNGFDLHILIDDRQKAIDSWNKENDNLALLFS